jgi:hypothetical protein
MRSKNAPMASWPTLTGADGVLLACVVGEQRHPAGAVERAESVGVAGDGGSDLIGVSHVGFLPAGTRMV